MQRVPRDQNRSCDVLAQQLLRSFPPSTSGPSSKGRRRQRSHPAFLSTLPPSGPITPFCKSTGASYRLIHGGSTTFDGCWRRHAHRQGRLSCLSLHPVRIRFAASSTDHWRLYLPQPTGHHPTFSLPRACRRLWSSVNWQLQPVTCSLAHLPPTFPTPRETPFLHPFGTTRLSATTTATAR